MLAVFTAILIVCLISAGHLFAPLLNARLLSTMENALKTRVDVSDIDIGLLTGTIAIKNIRIRDSALLQYKSSFTAGQITVDISLLPSFVKKEIILNKIIINDMDAAIDNVKRNPAAESTMPKSAVAGVRRPDEDKFFKGLRAKKILISGSSIKFSDHSTAQAPTLIILDGINGYVNDLVLSFKEPHDIRGAMDLQAMHQTYGQGRGYMGIRGNFARRRGRLDFDLGANAEGLKLSYLRPYLAGTSFAVLKDAQLDLSSDAHCIDNSLDTKQKVRMYDIQLDETGISDEDVIFGLPAVTVIKFFKGLNGDINFSFKIVGTIDDPKFEPGPIIRQIMSDALRDRIVARLKDIPASMVEMGEKAIQEKLKDAAIKLKGIIGE